MNSNTKPIETLPPLFYTHNNTISDNLTEIQNIQKRNAVIDEFLDSLDNKNNLNYSNASKNNENSDNEEDEVDDFFEGLKYLKKDSKLNSNDVLKQKIKRPKFNERKISSLFLSNKNNIKNNLNLKSNSHKNSAFSFDDNSHSHSNSNNHIEKISTLESINTNKINSNFSQKQFNAFITDYGNKKNKKLPNIKKNLKLRNCNTKNYFLNSLKSNINNNVHNIVCTEEKNKNSKWTNRKLLNNIDLYFSNNPPSHKYLLNLNQRSKSHIGNRVHNNNLNTMNREVNKEILNLSPNYIAAQLYKNNSYFKKGLKRNYTAKIDDNIFNTNLNDYAKENILFSERQKDKNKKFFNDINNNKNFNNKKKQNKMKNSFRKFFNERNAKFGMNWINTVINKKLYENLNNKNDLTKKQLKLKLTLLGENCNLKNDDKFFM